MSTLITVLLITYLVAGALLATAYVMLDSGTSGRGVNLGAWLAITVIWLPWILWSLFKLAAMILLPVSWTRRW
jgi:hypothetical protein